MDNIELNRLRDAIQRRYQDRIRQAEEERDKDFAALDRIAELQSGLSDVMSFDKSQPDFSRSDSKPSDKIGNVELREIINSFPGNFSITDVRKIAEEKGREISRPSFHFVIQSMIDKGDLELVERGQGKKGSVYRKVDKNTVESFMEGDNERNDSEEDS